MRIETHRRADPCEGDFADQRDSRSGSRLGRSCSRCSGCSCNSCLQDRSPRMSRTTLRSTLATAHDKHKPFRCKAALTMDTRLSCKLHSRRMCDCGCSGLCERRRRGELLAPQPDTPAWPSKPASQTPRRRRLLFPDRSRRAAAHVRGSVFLPFRLRNALPIPATASFEADPHTCHRALPSAMNACHYAVSA